MDLSPHSTIASTMRQTLTRKSRSLCSLSLCLAVSALLGSTANADEANWIWSTGSSLSDPVEPGTKCLFRKPINLRVPSEGLIEIAADDNYELYLNGNLIGRGGSPKQVDEYDITDQLQVGRNVVAVSVVNTHGNTAALAARVAIKPENKDSWYTFSSDASWRTTTQAPAQWQTVVFNDRLWGAASSYGKFGETAPWDHVADTSDASAGESTPAAASSERFQVQRGFGVQRVMSDDKLGSVISMTFNEFGHILVGQEGGPLLLVYDADSDGVPEKVRTYCDKVTSCQGILPLNGEVFVTGNGPDGQALYRLTDADRNGTLEKIQAIVKFEGKSNEHGPHGLRLGPDGMIYIAVGSHSQVSGKRGIGDTYRDPYEGDLLPRYHDPGGHGRSVKAPGGTIVRTNIDGSVVERVAGGLRNAYDVVFTSSGGLFVHDADAEADINTAWYRPTALFDVTEGAEFGWRTGWAKWPEHYYDRLPNLLDTGRGSPTGGVCYQHFMFPVRYQNTMFLADWSEGRILNVKIRDRGASYVADSEVFLKGQPLNVTDIEVGPDGALYFCTGGRGTGGGIYRVVYKGEVPDRIKKMGTGVAAAIRQPQLESAWARQEIAKIKRDLGAEWPKLVAGVAYSDDNPTHYRVRAMELMQLFGPAPSEELLLELSESPNEQVRARAAVMMGLHPGQRTPDQLVNMLQDGDPRVRRSACEAMLRSGIVPPTTEQLVPLLADEDRTIAFTARRVLERMKPSKFQDEVLNTADIRVGIVGMMALVNAKPTEDTARAVLARASEMMTGFLSDADFVDVCRLCQVALHRSKINPKELTALRDQFAEEFPAGDSRMNREVIQLAAHLDASSIAPRALKYISSNAKKEDRIYVAMCLPLLSVNWTAEERFKILKFYEEVAATASGGMPLYISDVTRDFAKTLSADDALAILEQGHVWRNAALGAIYKLERPINGDTAKLLRDLDGKLVINSQPGEAERRLRTGIIAMLSTSDEKESAKYLRKLWRSEPERRDLIAMALSVKPNGENWDYLVRSFNVLNPKSADEVLTALKSVDIATDDPMAIRQLILLGVRAEKEGAKFEKVEQLLEHWTGKKRPSGDRGTMRHWQVWYQKMYPDRPRAELPKEGDSRWDFEQLISYLDGDRGRVGDPIHGRRVYTTAKCADCHQFGSNGTRGIGPDLSGISQRFTKREVVESVLYPSHVISDQYASKKVLTLDGTVLTGMVTERNDGSITIRDSKNNVTMISENEIDQILPSTSSIMPSGLVDGLTQQEISDLLAYMGVLPSAEVARRPVPPPN